MSVAIIGVVLLLLLACRGVRFSDASQPPSAFMGG